MDLKAQENEALNEAPRVMTPNRASRDLVLSTGAAVGRVGLLSEWLAGLDREWAMCEGGAVIAVADRWCLQETWKQVLRRSHSSLDIHAVAELARNCMQADRLLFQWVDQAQNVSGGRLWRQFLGWRSRVQERLADAGSAPPGAVAERVAQRLERGDPLPMDVTPAIELRGFAELTLAEQRVLGQLEARGMAITRAPLPSTGSRISLQRYEDVAAECAAAAAWASEQLRAGAKRIAIIATEAIDTPRRLLTALENALEPASALAHASTENARFHLADGWPLGDHPLVQDALLLLDLAHGGMRRPVDFPRVSRWLLSPAWRGARTERVARAALELDLRRAEHYHWSLAQVLEKAYGKACRDDLPLLVECLDTLDSHKVEASPATRCCEWLKRWGWRAIAMESTDGQNMAKRLGTLFERLERSPAQGMDAFLALLGEAVAQTRYPVAGGALSPVQVLSPEAAYGQSFDALWLTGMREANWPPRPLTNPLLSTEALQRIPRACEEGVHRYAGELTEALMQSAPQVRVSFSSDGHDTPHFLSPLLVRHVPNVDVPMEQGSDSGLWRQATPAALSIRRKAHPWLRSRPDHQAPERISTNPVQQFASLLDHQSACPLAAFLVHRLNARIESPPQPFASPRLLGTVVHNVLEALHREKATSADSGALEDTVARILSAKGAHRQMAPLLVDFECRRIATLVSDWIDFEKSCWPHRPARLEVEEHFCWQGLNFRLRPDRLDATGPDRLFVIDYKTGATPNLSPWLDARPYQWQLPLYAVLLDARRAGTVSGFAVASVRRGEMKWTGVCNEPEWRIRGITAIGSGNSRAGKAFTAWTEALAHWRSAIDRLCDEWCSGDARHVRYHEAPLAWSGLEPVLRSRQAERWLHEVETRDAG